MMFMANSHQQSTSTWNTRSFT